MRQSALFFSLIVLSIGIGPDQAQPKDASFVAITMAQNNPSGGPPAELEPLPEEKMRRRFPQPIRAGALIGLPILDWRDSTIGYIRQVVRKPDGKIQLVVPYGKWLGWLDAGGRLDEFRRPVAVPIETVAILGRQVAALDMSREEFEAAPTYDKSSATPLFPADILEIAITRR